MATTVSLTRAADKRLPSLRPSAGWLMLPGVAILGVFFFYPLSIIVWRSFAEPQLGLSNYVDMFNDGITVRVMVRTLRTGLVVAAAALVIAYPYAYAMTRVTPRVRGLLMIVVLLPFWTSVLARNYAWYLLEQRGGVIERFFASFGFDSVVLLGTNLGVTVAMIQVMLPMMVLPLYSSMVSIDFRLVDAAMSLGASRARAMRQIYLPLSIPGILSGFSLVFIVTLGFYITPSLLGSPSDALISQVIAARVQRLLDFAGAGALGVVLLAATLVVVALVGRLGRVSAVSATGVDRG